MMQVKKRRVKPKDCPRCIGGSMMVEYDSFFGLKYTYWCCQNCGHQIPIKREVIKKEILL